MNREERLKLVDEVIAAGPYKDNWASLCNYTTPKWYADAKFGIFIHWGVYSVPAFHNEWYARTMYIEGSPEYEHHIKTYGPHKDFGYKDFIPMFKAEHFDANEWMTLFREAGAKYVMPVAEHHDGFQMYDSDLSDWNAAKMGPKRDVVGELKQAAEKEGIVFSVSNHRAEHCWFFNGGLKFDSDILDPKAGNFYGPQQPEVDSDKKHHDIHFSAPNKEHADDWLARICELVDKYQPRIVWFDWWIHNIGFKPYIKKFAAYYYNRAKQWGVEVAINYKYRAYAYGSAIFDVERGQLEGIRPLLWQTDTAVARNSWCYTDNNEFKAPTDLVRDLIDIVSKNGCLLLNIGPRPDGTITDEDKNVLLNIGKWLKINGEGIYGTTFWEIFGEGNTNAQSGSFTDGEALQYTNEDFRFTFKGGNIYAFAMNPAADGKMTIKSLGLKTIQNTGDMDIKSVSLLGCDLPVKWTRDQAGLHIEIDNLPAMKYPLGIKVETD